MRLRQLAPPHAPAPALRGAPRALRPTAVTLPAPFGHGRPGAWPSLSARGVTCSHGYGSIETVGRNTENHEKEIRPVSLESVLKKHEHFLIITDSSRLIFKWFSNQSKKVYMNT